MSMQPDALEGFACTQCGNCCRMVGYVRLTDTDVEKIAGFLGLGVDAFTDRNTRLLPDRSGLALLEQPDGACAFLSEEGLCGINAVKPEQCKGFPYAWRYADMESICEGWRTT
jgi:uncharacterized protein